MHAKNCFGCRCDCNFDILWRNIERHWININENRRQLVPDNGFAVAIKVNGAATISRPDSKSSTASAARSAVVPFEKSEMYDTSRYL